MRFYWYCDIIFLDLQGCVLNDTEGTHNYKHNNTKTDESLFNPKHPQCGSAW